MKTLKFSKTLMGGIFLTMVLTGCTVSTQDTIVVKGKPTLSSGSSATNDQINAEELYPSSIAVLPFANETEETGAADIIRTTIQNHLSSKNFSVASRQSVDATIGSLPDINSQLIAETLGVEGTLRGTIHEFQLLHAGVYAEIKLTVSLELQNQTGSTVWKDRKSVTSRAGGVSSSPWGLLLNAVIATRHLSEKNLLAAADELGREFSSLIPEPPSDVGRLDKPMVQNVLHDAGSRVLKYGDTFTVGLRGEPNSKGQALIETIGIFDLEEQEPGVYIKEIPVDKAWNARGLSVQGKLTNSFGASTTWLSPAGLLSFDNTPPPNPQNLRVQTLGSKSVLSWDGSDDSISYRITEHSRSGSTQLGETESTSFNIGDMPLFKPVTLHVESRDLAGNWSTGSSITQEIFPVPGIQELELAPNQILADVRGSFRFSRKDSPFKIEGKVTIGEEDTLFIEPGVVIQMGPASEFIINGEAYMWGTTGEILITSAPGQAPAQYMTLSSSRIVSFKGVNISDGKQGVIINSGAPQFEQVRFNNNAYGAVTVKNAASPEFAKCDFSGSQMSGLIVSDYAKVKVSSSKFSNNSPFHIQSSSVYPISMSEIRWAPVGSEKSILGAVDYE